jgi:LmbE family N-acetylglucosaminyl deacetylase
MSISQPASACTHVYLSPHLDDVALSCGGQVYQQSSAGQTVVVVTLCAGLPATENTSPFAESLHARWQVPPAQAMTTRRAEDLAALAQLGAAGLHLDVPDCIYRVSLASGGARYASEEALWGALHPEEAGLAQRCAETLRARLQHLPGLRWYVPLSLGHHVDHQLARRAAELAFPVWAYYEDYPYADREANLSPHSKVTGEETLGLRPEVWPLSAADLRAKCRAVAAYTSQLSTFWESPAAMEASLASYASHLGAGQWAERLWRATAPTAP